MRKLEHLGAHLKDCFCTCSIRIFGMIAIANFCGARVCSLVLCFAFWVALYSPVYSAGQALACKFNSYAIEAFYTNGAGPDLLSNEFKASLTQRILDAVPSKAKLVEVDAKSANVLIHFVFDYDPYRVPKRKQQTLIDFMKELKIEPTDAFRFRSPWLYLGLSDACVLRVVVIDNVRQMIADQACLAGVQPIKNGIATFSGDPLVYLPKIYEREVIQLGNPTIEKDLRSRLKPKVIIAKQREAINRLSEYFPADLLWFFSHAKSTKYMTDSGTFFSVLNRNTQQLLRHTHISIRSDC